MAYLERHIPNLPDSTLKNLGLWDRIKQLFKGPRFHVSRITEGTIRWYGLQVAIKTIAAVGDVAQAADLLSTVVIGGGGLPIGNVSNCHWNDVQKDKTLMGNPVRRVLQLPVRRESAGSVQGA